MEFISLLDGSTELKSTDVGGKGESLNTLTCIGINVPKVFAICTTAFTEFTKENNLHERILIALENIEHKSMAEVTEVSNHVQSLISLGNMPEGIASEILETFTKLGCLYVAVRSSASSEDGRSAAWAGQLETFLNTTRDNVIENVIMCWASLYSPRALHYSVKKGSLRVQSVSVLLQEMVQSDVSGIAFSVHPVTENTSHIIVEAGRGLGEAIVLGQIQPSTFVINKESREILSRNISDQSKMLICRPKGGNCWFPVINDLRKYLTDEILLKLTETIIVIEKTYGYPVDIEWCLEGSRIFILQCRPITSLK